MIGLWAEPTLVGYPISLATAHADFWAVPGAFVMLCGAQSDRGPTFWLFHLLIPGAFSVYDNGDENG